MKWDGPISHCDCKDITHREQYREQHTERNRENDRAQSNNKQHTSMSTEVAQHEHNAGTQTAGGKIPTTNERQLP